MNCTECAQCRRRPSVGERQVVLDPEGGVAQAAKPADRAGRGSVESSNAGRAGRSKAQPPPMMRQLQGGAMPRHGRVGPLAPPVTDALGEDLSGDGVVKIGDARITHEVWRKSAAHVSRPGKATETHQMVVNQGVRHQAKLLQILGVKAREKGGFY